MLKSLTSRLTLASGQIKAVTRGRDMNLDRLRARIESGAAGLVASLLGFVNLFVPVLISIYWTESPESQRQFLEIIYFVSVGMLCLGSVSGVVISLASLLIRSTRLAWLGLLVGFVALLFVPTYLLPVCTLLRGA